MCVRNMDISISNNAGTISMKKCDFITQIIERCFTNCVLNMIPDLHSWSSCFSTKIK
jgi:hypothetical protein